jgi:hypothetical protein
MTVKVLIVMLGLMAAVFGALKHDLAAVYIATASSMIVYFLYSIEMKIDRILANSESQGRQSTS